MEKIIHRVRSIALIWVMQAALMAASPVNDRFSNRTRVEGTRIEMDGTFLGATREAGEPGAWPDANASVWWSWTAPVSGLVLMESGSPPGAGGVCVSRATNVERIAATEEVATSMPMCARRYATFQAVAGQEYQIGAFGTAASESAFELRLCLTNAPMILRGPVTQMISPGGCALFTVGVAAVESGLARIQWQFEGADIAKENSPLLARTNATASMAGEYRAIVSHTDAIGNLTVRTSSVARLNVQTAESPRLLITEDPAAAGMFLISVAGEPGRWYQVQSFDLRSEIWNVGEMPCFSSDFPRRTTPDGRNRFFGITVFEPSSPVCWLNMRRIHFAKERLAADLKLPIGTITTLSLTSQIHDRLGHAPECPVGGFYIYGPVGTPPSCNIAGHIPPFDFPD